MANENPSRDSASRQQSADRSQTASGQQGSTTQGQGTYGQGTHGQGGVSQGSPGAYGQGGTSSHGQGVSVQGSQGYGQGSQGYGQGSQGAASGSQGTSTWQGGRSSQGGALSRRGTSSMSPYSQGYEAGYGSGPFSIMRRISDEMDRFFENFGMGRSLFPSQQQGSYEQDPYGSGQGLPSMWSPHIEVCERNGKLLIQADLPGLKRDDINVRVEQDAVIIQGQRQQQQTSNQSGYYRSERSYGSFYRTIPLPEGVNAESASATFRDGVLEIELDAPRQQQRGRTLEIRDSTGGGTHASGGATGSSYAGTGSGSTYGSGTSGSMQGSTTGGTQHAGSGTSGSHQAATGASGQQAASGTSGGSRET
jgi:HSP20 family protein